MAHPQQRFSPEVDLQVKEERDLARKKIERYEHLIATLYDELDALRNRICSNCKTKFVPGATSSSSTSSANVTPPVFRGPAESQSDSGNPQASSLCIAEAPNVSSLSTRIPLEPAFVPPPAAQPHVDNTPMEVDEADWSVEHNHEVRQSLSVHLANTLKMTSKVSCVKFSREGKHLAVGLETGETYIYDIKTMSNRVLVEHPPKRRSILAIQFSPDDKYVAVGGLCVGIKIWNIVERRVLTTFGGHYYFVSSVDFSPDGRFLVLLSFGIHIWCMRDGSSRKLADTEMPLIVKSVAVSPDGRYVVGAYYNGVIGMWDFRSGHLLARWNTKGNATRQLSVVFTSDGKGLLGGGEDGIVRSWDVSSVTIKQSVSRGCTLDIGTNDKGKEIITYRRHRKPVFSVSTFPDSRWILSSFANPSVVIWDAQTGIWQCTLKGHQDTVMKTDTSSDGYHLASGSHDCVVRIWRYGSVQN